MNIKKNRPLVIDLFAGCGGLSLGFEQAGFDIVASVEIDPIHSAVHKYNFPCATTICADIRQLTGSDIRHYAQLPMTEIDVVVGGAPCQGFSLMGKRSLEDPRNQLVKHYVRLISELKPKYCVFENVKGLTLGKHVQFLDDLIALLDEEGYNVLSPYRVLNASDYGVPQNRERLFLIAARKGLTLPSYPQKNDHKVTVEEAIGDLPDADSFDELIFSDCVTTSWETKSSYAGKLRGLKIDLEDFGYCRKFDKNILSASLRTKHTELTKQRFMKTEQGKTEPHSRFFKLHSEGQSNTIRAGTDSARGAFTSPRPIHPCFPRVITVREAARLHSYPDWFRFHKTKWHGAREIGNSVPPLLARSVAAQIIKALGIIPEKPKEVLVPGAVELLEFDMTAAANYFSVSRMVIAQRTRKKKNGAENAG